MHNSWIPAVCAALVFLGTACAVPTPAGSEAIVTVKVTTSVEGISPDATEANITVPLERRLADIKSLHDMRSISAHGVSTIWLQFKGTSAQDAIQLVQQRVAPAISTLPAGVKGPVVSHDTR